MIVSINTICFFDRDRNNYLSDDYWVKIFFKIATEHTEHQFIFFSEKHIDGLEKLPNLTLVVFGEIPNNFLRARIWFHFKIKRELKKNQSDILVQIGGFPIKSKMPQVLLSPDLTEIISPKELSNAQHNFLKKRISNFFKNLQRIIVFSQWEKNKIGKKYPGFDDKIQVWNPEISFEKKPFSLEEKELIKEKFAGGNEFFIYSGLIGSRGNLMNLLKAFSAFKKRQKSGMQLIITGNKAHDFDNFSASLENYRFKNEVNILPALSYQENFNLLQSSYAIIFPSIAEMPIATALQAMNSCVPILASEDSIIKEISEEVALYFNSENFRSIAEKMMLIFKDENLKKELVKKGLEKARAYQSSNHPLDLLNLLTAYTKKSLQ